MTLIINGKTYEAGELIAYVKTLEKENEELRKVKQVKIEVTRDYKKLAKDLQEQGNQLTKAKEIIKTFCGFCGVFNSTNGSLDNIIAKAEQFLNSEVEK